MYEAFYECSERPFAAAPNAARYFPGNAIEQARQNLARVIERSEGTGLVIGPAGTGKTLLLEVLAAEFRARLATVLLANGRLNTVRALLQAAFRGRAQGATLGFGDGCEGRVQFFLPDVEGGHGAGAAVRDAATR